MVKVVSLSHPSNRLLGMELMELGKEAEVKPMHLEKEPIPKFKTDCGMLMVCKPLHPAKA